MPRFPRDRISVDLRGLGASLCARARALGVSPSELVRRVLADALDAAVASTGTRSRATDSDEDRVRLSLRMTPQDARAARAAAERAGLSCGAYVAGLIAGIPALQEGAAPSRYLAALNGSNAEMASLGRDLGHLVDLFRHGSTDAAREYRERLDGVADEVRKHLVLASTALAALRSRRGNTLQQQDPPPATERGQP